MKKLFQCPSCETKLKIEESLTKPVSCPKCGFSGTLDQYRIIESTVRWCPECHAEMTIASGSTARAFTCGKCGRTFVKSVLLTDKPAASSASPSEEATTFSVAAEVLGLVIPGRQTPYCLERGITRIGRSVPNAEAQILISDSFVSRAHAEIELALRVDMVPEYRLRDCGSSNGTFVNDIRIDPDEIILLTEGDVLRVGKTELRCVKI